MTLQRQEEEQWLEIAIRANAAAATARARAFQSASRHSRAVRWLRVGLPMGAVFAVFALALFMIVHSWFSHFGDLTMASLSVDGTKISMEKPRLTSARQDGGGYVMSADRAIEDLKNPNETDLVNVVGDIGARGQPSLKLTSTEGHFNSEKEIMDLWGVVRLRTADYRVEMTRARIDFKSGFYETHEPVKVFLTTGTTISAGEAAAADNASLMTFVGRVKTFVPAGAAVELVPEIQGENR